ncbi:MAG TPA: hypothetical protein VLZ29_01240 [Sulfurimonas sp.]|uniref:hypothetical protein n=1 Tax=Sulfurimonas sp. TaxID=2022749 RepID=UPI002CCD7103|nr:hypothetical protein [Sulfurimonas sp.]HUH41722.1 hypothetical protein [Sulfurimonas sp.]
MAMGLVLPIKIKSIRKRDLLSVEEQEIKIKKALQKRARKWVLKKINLEKSQNS